MSIRWYLVYYIVLLAFYTGNKNLLLIVCYYFVYNGVILADSPICIFYINAFILETFKRYKTY